MELVEAELGFWVTKKMTNVFCIMANVTSSLKCNGKSETDLNREWYELLHCFACLWWCCGLNLGPQACWTNTATELYPQLQFIVLEGHPGREGSAGKAHDTQMWGPDSDSWNLHNGSSDLNTYAMAFVCPPRTSYAHNNNRFQKTKAYAFRGWQPGPRLRKNIGVTTMATVRSKTHGDEASIFAKMA